MKRVKTFWGTVAIALFSIVIVLSLFSCSKKEHIHSFGEWAITKNATCTEPGEQERLCSCGEKQTQTIPEKGHSFGEWKTVKNATCTEAGEQARSCSCGEKQTESIPAKGHLFGEWKIAKDASCTESGIQERYCECGEKQTEVISPKGHSFGEWVVTIMPTCTEAGIQECSCFCGEKQTQSVAAKGHTFGAWNVVKEATCTTDGQKRHICSTCGQTENQTLPAAGHKWKNATCTEPKQCTVCGLSEGAELGHDGNPGDYCSRCGKQINLPVKFTKDKYITKCLFTEVEISSLSYEFNNSGDLIISFNAKKLSDSEGPNSTGYVGAFIRFKGSDGSILYSTGWSDSGLMVGDSMKIRLWFPKNEFAGTQSITIEFLDDD